MTDEQEVSEVEQARRDVGKAIEKFYATLFEGEIVTDWVVVAQRNSVEFERQGHRATGTLAAAGQTTVTTRGLLEMGIDIERKAGGL